VVRSLFDFKEDQSNGKYGSVIQTGFLVSLVQGMLILGLGVALAPALAYASKIPEDLRGEFIRLMEWQCVITAAGFPTRMFSYLLVARHRLEIPNYAQTLGFAASLVVLWLCLRAEWKLQALVAANAAGWLVGTALAAAACCVLKVFPRRGTWGSPNRKQFASLMTFGRDVFLVAVGVQFIMASQALIVTRAMGLEAAAVWTVCTKTYVLLSQAVWRIYDFSASMFVEMIVQEERQRLRDRFRSLVMLTGSVSALAAVLFAVTNEPFVTLWTAGKLNWPNLNNCLLGVWLVLVSVLRCNSGLILLTREIGFLRYVYFIEGIVFFVVSSIVAQAAGFPALIGTSIACSLCFSGAYGVWRSAKYFELSFREVSLAWLTPAAQIGLRLALWATVVWVTVRGLPTLWRLVISGILVAVPGVYWLLRLGLPRELKAELLRRVPERFGSVLRRAIVS